MNKRIKGVVIYMNEQEMDLNYVFNEMPIYSKETFAILNKQDQVTYKIDRNEVMRFFKYINTESGKIITHCIWCDKEFSFNYNHNIYLMNSEDYIIECSSIQIAFSDGDGAKISLDNGQIWGLVNKPILQEDLIERNYYLTYYISCNNNSTHLYSLNLLISIQKDKLIVTKVGQYPTMLSIKGFDFDKYKKQLKRYDAYEDYKNADLSMANNFHAGAYTYLRRVYEKQLNYYVEKDKPVLTDNRTETRIKAVKNNFDPRIHEHLSNLYSILSIGIHELDEEESKNYYEYLKAMIDMQLQYEKSKDEEDKQTKSLSTKISNIVNFLNKRKSKNDS